MPKKLPKQDAKDAALERKAHAEMKRIRKAKQTIADAQSKLHALHEKRVARAAELVAMKEKADG